MIEQYKQEAEKYTNQYLDLPWENKDFYAEFLAQTFHFVKFSTRIIAYAIARLPEDNQQVYKRLLETLKEESFHDIMCVNDMKHLGFDINNYEMKSETKALFGPQFFNIDHHGVAAYFGYALGLEMLAAFCGEPIYYKLEKHYEPKALSFLKLHVFEDKQHIVDALKAVELLPAEDRDVCWTIYNETLELYNNFVSTIAKSQYNKHLVAA
jgi:hypothetical protein